MKNLEQYYRTLELNPPATKEEIKKAYRQLAKKWHPDHHTDKEKDRKIAQQKFLEISEAYHVLLKNNDFTATSEPEEKGYTTYSIDATYFYELGVEAAEKEEWQEAVHHFDRAIKMDDRFESAYFYRGIALEKQGFELRARGDFDKFNDLKNDRLNDTLQQVISNLESLVSRQYSRQGIRLINIIDDIATIECKNYHLRSQIEDKKADFERAFTLVCDRRIEVKFKLEDKKIVSNSQPKTRVKKKMKLQSRQNSTGNLLIAGMIILICISFSLVIARRNNSGEQIQFDRQQSLENS